VEEYAEFLACSTQYWDYAFDFDADIFLGGADTDRLHEKLLYISGLPKKRIIRVYHMAREGCDEWWEELCQNPEYTYISIEGGGSHSRDPKFYRPMIDIAHRYGKLVHVLAISSKNFLTSVPVDTVDSSTHNVGGRFALVYTPFGQIAFSKYRRHSREYSELDNDTKEKVDDYFAEYGFIEEDLTDNEFNRKILNILFMNRHWDVPFVETGRVLDLFGREPYFE
jgi:hypothetical protein